MPGDLVGAGERGPDVGAVGLPGAAGGQRAHRGDLAPGFGRVSQWRYDRKH